MADIRVNQLNNAALVTAEDEVNVKQFSLAALVSELGPTEDIYVNQFGIATLVTATEFDSRPNVRQFALAFLVSDLPSDNRRAIIFQPW